MAEIDKKREKGWYEAHEEKSHKQRWHEAEVRLAVLEYENAKWLERGKK